MAIQSIPPFATQLPANTQGPAASNESENTDAAASVSAVETEKSSAASANPVADATANPAALTREQIDQAMGEVKRALAPVARNLQFSVDDATGRTVIKVIDSSNNQLIRQIPSEELLAITKALDSFSGLFVKQKA